MEELYDSVYAFVKNQRVPLVRLYRQLWVAYYLKDLEDRVDLSEKFTKLIRDCRTAVRSKGREVSSSSLSELEYELNSSADVSTYVYEKCLKDCAYLSARIAALTSSGGQS